MGAEHFKNIIYIQGGPMKRSHPYLPLVDFESMLGHVNFDF